MGRISTHREESMAGGGISRRRVDHQAAVGEDSVDIDSLGGEYGNALQTVSGNGNESLVKLLLEKSTDSNAQGGYFGNALPAASVRGRRNLPGCRAHPSRLCPVVSTRRGFALAYYAPCPVILTRARPLRSTTPPALTLAILTWQGAVFAYMSPFLPF
ncbi:hypothetical protein EW146_g2861 [Bondarzewia mesenterica]|uniref:Uncharacterized protein n=1 Tax=Bondarzewia mesenterica TaxID=1095465 RepID=A0A4S4LZB3_9AGAM|nr:hypothetical protein EW146_g2861 [Bondarzewia mesenterica]